MVRPPRGRAGSSAGRRLWVGNRGQPREMRPDIRVVTKKEGGVVRKSMRFFSLLLIVGLVAGVGAGASGRQWQRQLPRRRRRSTSAPSAALSVAHAVNASGQVVGRSITAGDAALMRSRGRRRAGWSTSAPSAALQLRRCGERERPGRRLQQHRRRCRSHAFSWTPAGGMVDLGTLGGTCSDATAVNASGQVVGFSTTAGRRRAPCVLVDAGGRDDRPRHPRRHYSEAAAVNAAARSSASAPPPGCRPMRSRGRRRAGWSISAPSAAAQQRAYAVNAERPGRRLQLHRRRRRRSRVLVDGGGRDGRPRHARRQLQRRRA